MTSRKVYTATFELESPIKSVAFAGTKMYLPDGSGEHSHATVFDGDELIGTFDLDRVVTIRVTPENQ